jgi:Spy/CpxP family protein refolding chaperone
MKKLQLVAAATMIAMSATSAIAQGGGGGGGGGGGQGRGGAGQMQAMMAGITPSAEQQVKIDTIVAKYRAMNSQIPQDDADRRTKMMANTTKRNDEIKAVLTDDQKKVFEKNLADLAARMQGGGRPPMAA